MPPTGAGRSLAQPSIKRQGSMENLRGSDDGRRDDDTGPVDFSDCEELFAESRSN